MLFGSIFNFFLKGHSRTILAKRNILISFFVKSLSIAINLILVPITINYVNPTQYGIWLTLSSIIIWFSYFDIGFGNGLKNKFAEAKATGDYIKGKILVSTTYAVLTVVFTILWIIFYLCNNFIDWTEVLNTPNHMFKELSNLALIVFTFFCFQMIFKIINTVLIADQYPAKAAVVNLIGQILSFLTVLFLVNFTKGSLINLSLALGVSPVFILFVSSIYFFKKDYKKYSPSFRCVNFSHVKEIFNKGFGFFIIQISVIVVYETNNLIIAHIGSPTDVTIFNVAYKYFSVVFMFFSIIMSPFWSAFTDAFTKKEFNWMNITVQRLRMISYILLPILVLFVVFSKYAYGKWIGNSIQIPYEITLTVSFYIATLILLVVNNQVLNGIGKIRIQILTYSFSMIFHIPFAIYLGDIYGVKGVIFSAIIFHFLIYVFSFIQVNLLIKEKAKGIWNK